LLLYNVLCWLSFNFFVCCGEIIRFAKFWLLCWLERLGNVYGFNLGLFGLFPYSTLKVKMTLIKVPVPLGGKMTSLMSRVSLFKL
jgi:hypothetical protein